MSLYLGNDRVNLRSLSAIPYTIVGNPTITSDGIASGFTDKTDYLTLGAFNPGTNKWKFTTKVKFNSLSANMSLIDRNSSTRCFQIAMRTTGKWRVNISTDGSAKANEVDGTHVCTINTIYYLSFEYDGSKYYLKYSTDNINWTTDITINNSTKIYPVSTMCIGHSWYGSGTEKWDGEIYLRWTHLVVEGQYTDTWKLHALEGDYLIVDDKLVWANPSLYLEGFGEQWIDTGIKTASDLKIDIEYYRVSGQPFGYNGTIGGVNKSIGYASSSAGAYARIGAWYVTNNSAWANETWLKVHLERGRTNCTINGVIWTGQGGSQNTFSDGGNIGLFVYTELSSAENMVGKIKYFKATDGNDNVIQHLVPVPTGLQIGNFTVPSNGMFDIVNQQFYPNLGTGTFTYGKVV